MAPARDPATGRVAVDSGADAIYIGGPGFGARRAAGNSLEEVAALVNYARPFGVRVYATLNTLLFDDEIDEARRTGQELLRAGVDALIVQDMAWLRLGLSGTGDSGTGDSGTGDSGIEWHASTQTSNISPENVAFLGRAGFRRVILERALSLDEIRTIRAACPDDIELEVFVHGAICVGYSGRCFLSRSMDGSRSGNRGDCSQPCRLEWDLTDGGGGVLIRGRHLLSVRDLDLSVHLGELLDAGVSSFKIEGRLKDEGYVRNVVSHYRRLLDEAMAVRPGLRRASTGVSVPDFKPDPAKSFTRGGTDYYFYGRRAGGEKSARKNFAAGVASFDTPKAVGERIGTVAGFRDKRPSVALSSAAKSSHTPGHAQVSPSSQALCPPVSDENRFFTLENSAGGLSAGGLSAGDGICFFANGKLQGTNINRVEGGRVYPNRMEGITPGTEIYRNYDHAFVRALRRSRMARRIGVEVCVKFGESRVEIDFVDRTGLRVSVSREGGFAVADNPSQMAAVVREQLSRSGETIFEVRRVDIPEPGSGSDSGSGPDSNPCSGSGSGVVGSDGSGSASDGGGGSSGSGSGVAGGDGGVIRFVPVSVLAAMRREGLARLLEARRRLEPRRYPAIEDISARFPRTSLSAAENVTNRLAGQFYRDHGVTQIAPAMELRGADPGEVVMKTRYCIRRETGECLKENPRYRGELSLVRGGERLRLEFDCDRCEMAVKKITTSTK